MDTRYILVSALRRPLLRAALRNAAVLRGVAALQRRKANSYRDGGACRCAVMMICSPLDKFSAAAR